MHRAKRKRGGAAPKQGGAQKPPPKAEDAKPRTIVDDDDEINSDIASLGSNDAAQAPVDEDQGSDMDEETPDQKRLRLAKDFLEKMKSKGVLDAEDGSDAGSQVSGDELTQRLYDDLHQRSRKYVHQLADGVRANGFQVERVFRCHNKSVTAVALSPASETTCFSGGKDGHICMLDLATGQKKTILGVGRKTQNKKPAAGHVGPVLALAVSQDGNMLVSGGTDRIVRLWDTRTSKKICEFPGHRDTIAALAFREDSQDLFSACFDRTIKIWNAHDMAYMNTLYGHQAEVLSISMLHQERLVSGSRDGTVRYWKVPEETQLVFHGHRSCVDAVAMLSKDRFLSGGQDGTIRLWEVSKKLPVKILWNPHNKKWITSLCAIRQSDLCISGSSDGFVRFWKHTPSGRDLACVGHVPIEGYINAIAANSSASLVVCGVGQDHAHGRWESIHCRAGVYVLKRIHQ